MKQKIKDAITMILLAIAAVIYFVIGYEILTFFNIGAPGS